MENIALKILMVDSGNNLDQLKSFIKKTFPDADIYTAKTKNKKLEISSAEDFDVVIIGTAKQQMSVYEAYRKLEADNKFKRIPVIFLSDKTEDSQEHIQAIRSGADAFVSMPFNGFVLTTQILSMLRIRNAARKSCSVKKEKFENLIKDKTIELFNKEGFHEKRERLLHRAQKQEPFGSYEHDLVYDKFYCSDEALEIYGIKAEEFSGKPAELFDRIHPDDKEYVSNIIMQIESERNAVNCIHRIIRTDGETRIIDVYIEPIFNEEGEHIRNIGTIQDITERALKDKKLERSEISYRRLFESAKDGILILDAETGKIAEVNPSLTKMIGYHKDDFVGKYIWEMGVFQDIVANKAKLSELKDKEYFPYEYLTIETADGRKIDVEFVSNVYSADDKKAIQFNIRDITKRKQMENELDYERNMAKLYMDTANIMFLGIRRDETVESINKTGCDILGYSEKDIIGKNWFSNFVPKQVASKVRNMFVRVMNEEQDNAVFHENSIVNSRGEERIISWSNSVLKGKSGDIIGIFSTGKDITERRKAQAALRESEAKYSSYIENAPDGVFLADENGRYREVNKAASIITGYSKEELLNLSIPEILAEESVENGIRQFESLRKTGTLHGVTKYKHKNGTKRWWSVDAVKLSDTKFLGFSKDITEQKLAEERLAESEEKFRYVFDYSAIGKSLTLPNNKMIVNDAFCRMLGYSKEELKDKYWKDITYPDDIELTERELDKIISGKQDSVEINKRYIKKDNTVLWADVHTVLRRDSQGNQMYFIASIIDVTKRKKVIEELTESERSKSMLLSNLPGMSYRCIFDKYWTMKFLSKGCKALTGYEPESIIDNKKLAYNDVIAPQYREFVWEKFQNSVEKREAFKLEYQIITAEGKRKWVYEIGRGILDEEDKVEAIEGIIIDVNDKKIAEELLLRQEEEQRLLLENLQVGIVVYNADSSIIYSNQLAEEILGINRDHILDKRVADPSWCFVDKFGESLSIEEYPFSLVYKNKVKLVGYEVGSYNSSSKDIRWLMVNGLPVIDEDGQVDKVLISFMDVSEKKKIEKNYEMIIKTAMDGFWLIDTDGHILEANDSNCGLMGYTREEMLGMTVYDIDHNERKDNHIEEIIEQGVSRFEAKHVSKDGTEIDVEVSAHYLEESQKIFVFIHDLTDRKEKEKKRMLLETQLRNQQKLESIGTLASGVAHEINNPLNGVLNYGQIILDTKSENDSTKEYAKEIIRETNRIAVIVRNLLAFSRQNKLEYSYVNIEDVISQTLSLIKTIIKKDKIELNLNIAKNLPEINCNDQQIQQVIMNFVTNARDALNAACHNSAKNKVINLSCSEIERNSEKWLELIIEDFGAGISEEVRNKIFDPFFTTKDKSEGTGLGLSISYGIIKEHQGEIFVESQVNKYTRFIIQLPCDREF